MRQLIAIVAAVVAFAVAPQLAGAGGPGQAEPSPPVTTVVIDDGDVVGVGIGEGDATVPGDPGSSDSGGSSSGSGDSDDAGGLPTDCNERWQTTISGEVITWIDPASGDIMAIWETSCPGVLDLETRRYRAPTPGDLIPGFYGEVLVGIEPPVSLVNPPDASAINLGVWLATDGPVEIRRGGPVGPFTVEVVATLADTTFDMGNGDVVVCAGGGTPIVDLDTIEQGPCGYTYVDALGDGSVVTMTARWEISFATTIGDGVLPDVTISASVPYRTYEIQTVGTG